MPHRPPIDRRALVSVGLAGAVMAGPAAAEAVRSPGDTRGLHPGAGYDQSGALERALANAAADGRELRLPAGEFRIDRVTIPSGARLAGQGRATVLVGSGAGPLLQASGSDTVSISRLALRGPASGSAETPLLQLGDIRCAEIDGVVATGGKGPAIRLERCGGHVRECDVSGCDVGLLSLDAAGLRIEANTIENCADNGIQVWRSSKGPDGTLVTGNRISRIGNRSGGSGQYGNGVNVFRAGNVIISGNVIRDCAFSAVRNNAGDNVQITGNNCAGLGEVGIFVEFGFEGCVVANNVVDRASIGISMTNYDQGGRLASATGNILRNLFRRPDALTGVIGQGIGIAAEADAAVTGNVVDGAEFAGIWIGYGPHQRDVLCSGNVVRATPIGVAASVAASAGTAHIAGNLLSGCTRGAVVGYEWDKAVPGDLTQPGRAFANLTVKDNTVR